MKWKFKKICKNASRNSFAKAKHFGGGIIRISSSNLVNFGVYFGVILLLFLKENSRRILEGFLKGRTMENDRPQGESTGNAEARGRILEGAIRPA